MEMAHSCPECGQVCYCGGDIDDCLLDDSEAVNCCGHCPLDGEDDFEDDDYDPDRADDERFGD
jgi:hypothetical protein